MPKEIELRRRRCCFTGHRPEKLTIPEHTIKAALESKIRAAIGDGYQTFISGMARGVDVWAAETVLRLRREGARLICALPYSGFEARWSAEWQARYRQIVTAADWVQIICPQYSKRCFQIRNQWMVDHSARIIAVYNGTQGGAERRTSAGRAGIHFRRVRRGLLSVRLRRNRPLHNRDIRNPILRLITQFRMGFCYLVYRECILQYRPIDNEESCTAYLMYALKQAYLLVAVGRWHDSCHA